MHADFGYMEEGKLGKPYNLKLLKRLAEHAVPYWKIIVLALTVAVIITLFDLVLPYLTKVAIDRYILSSWEQIIFDSADKKASENFVIKYKEIIVKSSDNKTAFYHRGEVKKIDPAELQRLKANGSISEEPWYLLDRSKYDFLTREVTVNFKSITLSDGRIAIPISVLDKLPADVLYKVRSSDFDGLVKVGIFLIFLLLITFGLNYLDYYLLEYIGQNIMQDIRVALFERMQSRAIAFFNRHPVGRLVTRVTNDIENLNEMFM